jgi:hypothetical protein
MALSNAERQRRYITKLKAQAVVSNGAGQPVTLPADAYADISWIDDVIQPMCPAQRAYTAGQAVGGLAERQDFDWGSRLHAIAQLPHPEEYALLSASLVTCLGDDELARFVKELKPAARKRLADALTEDDEDDEDETNPKRIRAIYMARASACIDVSKFGYPGKVTEEIVSVARSVAAAWNRLAKTLGDAVS